MSLIIATAVFLTGIVSGLVGGVTSGGGGFVSLPVLIFLGLSPDVAVATQRFGTLGWNTVSIFKFSKAKKIIYKYVVPLMIVSGIGGVVGANLLVNVDKTLLAKIIGLVIMALVPVVLWKKKLGIEPKTNGSSKMMFWGFMLYFIVSIYDGFLGVGGGILVAYLFVLVFGMTYNQANGTDKVAVLLNLVFAVLIFAYHGLINYRYGIVYFLGTSVGGYLGAHMAIKKGDKWVRAVFVAVAVIFGIKLVFFS